MHTSPLIFSPTRVQELLYEQDRTQEWLASETGYSPEMISRYMQGRNPISLKFAVRAARALGVPVHWLAEAGVPA